MANEHQPMVGQTAEQTRAAREASERADKAQKEAVEVATKGVDDRRSAMEKQNAEYYERLSNVQPTPTARECDLAKVGALDLNAEKEDDGSESPEELQKRVMEGQINNPYVTRDMQSDRRKRAKGRK